MKRYFFIISIVLFSLFASYCFSQQTYQYSIKWKSKPIENSVYISDELPIEKYFYLNFEGAMYINSIPQLPYFSQRFELPSNCVEATANITIIKSELFNSSEIQSVKNLDILSDTINTNISVHCEQKTPYLLVAFIPILNKKNGTYEKITDFSITVIPKQFNGNKSKKTYADNSVLSNGKWVKLKINTSGIYQITYDELLNMGFVNLNNIKVYGNGGGLLPIMNNVSRYDDLVENAIYFEKGTDGIFNSGDYILFFAQAPTTWSYDGVNKLFKHNLHLFSDYSYYFITDNGNATKTIPTEASLTTSKTNTVTTFNDYAYHEHESTNLLQSGSMWVGEEFDMVTSYSFSFNFPNVVSAPSKIYTNVVARSPYTSSFTITSTGNSQTINIPAVNFSSSTGAFGEMAGGVLTITPTTSSISLNISYNKPHVVAKGWLNYIIVNVRRNLTMQGSQMMFRDIESVGASNISDFIINGTTQDTKIWDITDIQNIKEIQSYYSSGITTFRVATNVLRQFIAFNPNNFLKPSIVGNVTNQNLHGIGHPDLVIVTHPNFITSANELAEYHRNYDNLDVIVTTPEVIYNEFSSGAPDVSAIRDFMKMLYDKANTSSELPRYLLLFGDGSFDNRSNSSMNTNYILTYQSPNSLVVTGSYVSDDFFGLLDDSEGGGVGLLDIGVGRLPVKSLAEAQTVVKKIKTYTSSSSFNDWRNVLCFIGDDEEGNVHTDQSDRLCRKVDTLYPAFNIEKIFLDAYKQVSLSGGQRYPDVNNAINNRIRRGALIVNYTGHGNEIGLAHERVVTMSDINSWDNFNALPIFMTATCEFSRFDDYERISAGETILLNSKGGGIALFSTTRLVFSNSNYVLNEKFYNCVFQRDTFGEYYRLGDIMRLTKNAAINTQDNRLNFTLLGDPALQPAIPHYNVVTNSIIIHDNTSSDTINALSKVSISGEIRDLNNTKLTNYNGLLFPTIYDKPRTITTLANDGGSPFIFDLQNNILFKGKVSVSNGEFSFSFIVPKDISYNYGKGKISYYAYNNLNDAGGFSKDIIIGGSNDSLSFSDNQGPFVKLFLNNTDFVFGGITDQNPKLIAEVADSNGINTVGSGIGHDITAILDDNTYHTIVLNDYYEANLNSYTSGKIEYYFSNLSVGPHNLKFKVWDVLNNSSEAYIEFIVALSAELAIDHLLNYPNPFTTSTSFYFDHNQPNVPLDVILQIFTISGKLVKTIETQISSTGYRSEAIVWDGLDDFGNRIGRGVYIYRLKVRHPNGKTTDKIEKLVILK